MNNAIILDMPKITAQSIETDAGTPGFVDELIGRISDLVSTPADPVEILLERADAYESTQPGFAAELRAAAVQQDEAAEA